MKILMVAVGLTSGGTATVLKNICPVLMKRHQVTLLTNDEGLLEIICNKIIQLKTQFFPIPKYRFMPKLLDLIKKNSLNDYDIIHIFEYPHFAADLLTIKKNKFNPPIVISAHGTIHQFSEFPLNIFKKIHNFVMLKFKERVSFFIASTEAEKIHLSNSGIPNEKINVLHLGIKQSVIKREQPSKNKILYVGRLAKTKNIELLIDAFSMCKDKSLELIIAGPDYGMLKKLQKQVKKLNLEKKVFFKGMISDEKKEKLLSDATIFVHPSLEDVFSLSLIEAAASGVPCIAFNVEANSEIIEDMVSGKLVKNTDAQSLQSAIEELLNDKVLLEEISKNAIVMIPKKFNWEKTAETLEIYYEKLLIRGNGQ